MDLDHVNRLTKDLKTSATQLGARQARYLVDAYYIIQEDRKRSAAQSRALGESGEPSAVIEWFAENNRILEGQLKRALDAYSAADPLGQWARSIIGIGPVIAAGLLAHIDLDRAPTVGHIWRFAGLDPTVTWGKGQKRPWNAALKVLCWKIGESFTKVSGNENSTYGRLYRERKEYETERNEAGAYKDQAERSLETRNYDKNTDAYAHYSAGRLPPSRIHLRAQRYAVKMFLSHYHEMGYRLQGKEPPKPFIIEHGGHVHLFPASEAR